MSIKSFTASRSFELSLAGGQYSMKALSRVALFGRAFGIVQPPSQITRKIAGKIVRIIANLKIAAGKNWLTDLDIFKKMPRLPRSQGNRAGAD
jgi:hypothetical protein